MALTLRSVDLVDAEPDGTTSLFLVALQRVRRRLGDGCVSGFCRGGTLPSSTMRSTIASASEGG